MITLEHLAKGAAHIVAQVIKAKFTIGAIGHVGLVGGALVLVRNAGINHTGGHAKRGKRLAHPFAVAPRQIIIDRHNMHTAARERV